MKTVQKLAYFSESAAKWVARIGISCPSCGGRRTKILDRKFLVTQLRRCKGCNLIFRTPTGNAIRMRRFYEAGYAEGFTTDLPSETELARLLATRFRGTEKDYTRYLEVLEVIGVRPGARILDFGCSWGYGSWQLEDAGFDVSSFEISSTRCRFARERLNVDAHDTLNETLGEFDVIFSAHVLEHVAAVGPTIARLWNMLRSGGRFVAFTPNGSLHYGAVHKKAWHSSWGMVHPNLLDEVYYRRVFASAPMVVASSPYRLAELREWASRQDGFAQGELTGDELLCVAVKP